MMWTEGNRPKLPACVSRSRWHKPQVEQLEDRRLLATAFAITGAATLIRFETTTPNTVAATINVTGLQAGETLEGVDFRPATGQFYALGSTSRLYTINLATGAATAVGGVFSTLLNGTDFGFDFNPSVDRIRVVSDTGQNLRLNPNNGAVAGVDTALAYAAGDPNFGFAPAVTGVAYTNSFPIPPNTTLFGIDTNLDVLVTQGGPNGTPSPNTGQLFTVGALGFDASLGLGFDIVAGSNTAFAAWTVGGNVFLYTVNLTTGAATVVGQVGNVAAVRGLAVLPDEVIVTGADAGAGPQISVFNAVNQQAITSFFAFTSTFTGGVRIALSDVNRDGVADIIAGAGPGGGPQVRVFDGRTFQPLAGPLGSFFAFTSTFTGGVYVAGGDVNGDGFGDIIVGAGAGGGPQVSIFSGADGSLLTSFFAFTPTFTGGVRVSGGDVNGDLRSDIIAAAGPGGGPQITVFNGNGFAAIGSFFGLPSTFTGGSFVGAGDVNNDGRTDIIVGAGAGGGPQVSIFDANGFGGLGSFFALPSTFTGGVRVGISRNFNANGRINIIAGAGPGGGPQVAAFDASTLTALGAFFAYPASFTGGVFVRGS